MDLVEEATMVQDLEWDQIMSTWDKAALVLVLVVQEVWVQEVQEECVQEVLAAWDLEI